MTDRPERTTSPSDNDTLQSVLAAFAADGYDAEVIVRGGGRLLWRRCGHEVSAGDVTVDGFRRMEGASDPADMLLVAIAGCPTCGDRGAVVVHYGPTADEADADVLSELAV